MSDGNRSIKIDATLDKRDFMTNSRDIARAISSLKGTVAQTGRSIHSSASSYGTAFREASKAVREYGQRISEINSRINELRSKNAAVEQAAKSFRDLSAQIKAGEADLGRMVQKVAWLKTKNDKTTAAWAANEEKLNSARRLGLHYREQYNQEMDRGRAVAERLRSGKDADGNMLTDEQRASANAALKEYVARAKGYMETIKEYQDKYREAEATRNEMMARGEDKPLQEYVDAQEKLKRMQAEQTQRQSELNNMRENGYENADQTQEYKDRVSRLHELEEAAQGAQEKINNIKPPYLQSWENMTRLSGMISEGFGRIQNAAAGAMYAIDHPIQAIDRALGTIISKVAQTVASFARMAGSGAVSFLKRLAGEARNAVVQLAKLTANAVSSGFKKIASGAAAAAKGVLNFTRAHKRSHGGLKTGLKTILKYAFGVRSMFFLFRRLRTAISEGFGELKKQNPEVKASLDSLQTALNGLKGSLAAAFAPILTAVAPMLTTLINMLTSAMNTVAAFMSALGGGKTYAKAVGGLKATGNAAGGAGKKAKAAAADFDELHVVSSQSGGGGGGGGAGSAMKYQTEQISDSMQKLVKQIKELWDAGEYEKLGKLLGRGINKGLAKAYKAVKWENVKKTWTKAIDAFTGIFNGLVKSIDWNLIGRTISEGVNTLIHAADYLVTHIDFKAAGTALAMGLNGLFSDTNLFANAWEAFKKTIKGLLDFGEIFLEKFNETSFAESIRNAFENGGWDGIAEQAWEVIKTAFGKAGNFLNVLLGGDSYEEPNEGLKKYARQRPQSVTPTYTVPDTVWDDLSQNLADGFNKVVTDLTAAIEGFSARGAITALADWINKVFGGISWRNVGVLFGLAFHKVLEGLGTIITEWGADAELNGARIAVAINGFISKAFGDGNIGNTFSTLVKGAFNFLKAFVDELDEENLATNLANELAAVDWDGIARAAWDAFKTAVGKLGNFLTVFFGGDITGDAENAVEAVEQMWDRHDGSKPELDTSAAGLAKSVGGAISAILKKLDEWIGKIPWDEWGTKIHDFLAELPWTEWGELLAEGIRHLFTGLDDLLSAIIWGEDYKNNKNWQSLHPEKYAKHQIEERIGDDEELRGKYEHSSLMQADWLKSTQKQALLFGDGSDKSDKDTQEMLSRALLNILGKGVYSYAEGDYGETAKILQDLKDLQPEYFEAQKEWINANFGGGFNVDEFLAQYGKDADVLSKAIEMFDSGNYSVEEIVATVAEAGNEAQVEAIKSALADADISELVARAKEMVDAGFSLDDVIVDLESKGLTPEQIEALRNAIEGNTTAVENNTTEKPTGNASDDSNVDSTAKELFDKAIELMNSGYGKKEAIDALASSGASPEKLNAVDEALDHVSKTIWGWVENDDKVAGILGNTGSDTTLVKEFNSTADKLLEELGPDNPFAEAAKEVLDAQEALSTAQVEGQKGEPQNIDFVDIQDAIESAEWKIPEQAVLPDGLVEQATAIVNEIGNIDDVLDYYKTNGSAVFGDLSDEQLSALRQALEANTEAQGESNVNIGVSADGASTDGTQAGADVVDGVVAGVEEESPAYVDALTNMCEAGQDAFESTNEINSPSKVFEKFGKFIVDGLILGLQTLPAALKGVWDGLPEWAQVLLGNAAGDFKLAVSGGVEGGNAPTAAPGASNDAVDSDTKATKRQTKETKRLTKETKRNTKKRHEVDVNYEGAGFDTSSGKPKLNVKVNFVPGDEEASEEDSNGGLLGWLQALLDADTVEAKVELIRQGWENFKGWLSDNGLDENSPIGQLIDLVRNNFDTVMGFLGIDPNSPIGTFLKLLLDNADNLLEFLGIDKNTPISTAIELVLEKFKDIMDFLGIPKDSPIRAIVDLLLGNTDPEVEEAFGKDGSTISTFVELAKKGFTTFLKFLGIDTDNPLIQTAISLIANNFKSFLGFLGLDPNNPLIKVLASLGKKDPNQTPGTLFGTLISVLASLGKKDPNQSPGTLFGTLLTVLASVGYNKGVGKGSILDLFSWAKTAIANGVSRGNGVVQSSILNLFGWSKNVSANKAVLGDGVKEGSILNLFTWDKKVRASGTTRGSGVKTSSIISLFTWKNKVQANGANRGSLAKTAVTDLFTWGHGVTVTSASVSSAAKESIRRAVADAAKKGMKEVPVKSGGVIAHGMFTRFARGGVISGGMARYLSNVPHYAGGTTRAHGTVFVAGEAGPEVMGHINGRTEILNKSQIAEAIYSAVVAGMGAAVNALGTYIANHMTNCTNSIVQTIHANSGIAQISGLDYYAPAMVTSGMVPYDVAMQIARSTQELQNTLDANNEDLIQAMVSAIGNAANSIVDAMQQQMMRNAGMNQRYTTKQAIDDINRTSMMFGRSPLKGV